MAKAELPIEIEEYQDSSDRTEFHTVTPFATSRAAAPLLLFVDNQVSDFLCHRMELARAMRAAGFDVHVALPQEAGLERISHQGFPVHVIHLERMSTRPSNELRSVFSLVDLYRRLRPALVHHIGLKPALHGGCAARIAGVPAAVNTLTGLGHLFTLRTVKARVLQTMVMRGLQFTASHKNHRFILQNPEDLDTLRANGIISDDRTVLVKGWGVDHSLFTPKPEPSGPPVVLMASRLIWDKGVGEFVSAARALRSRGVHARFLLVGEPDHGHPSAVPMSTLEQWQKAGDVELLGWRHDMHTVIAQSHIVCLPSYYREGVPRILLEAAASGRPVVTTDTAGCREAVDHGENGLLVPVRDVDALAKAILQLLENAQLRVAMGARGREIAISEFSRGSAITAYLGVYRSMLVSNRGPAELLEKYCSPQ